MFRVFFITKITFFYYYIMVINPNNLTHTIRVVPRYYTTDTINLFLYNEATQETSNPTATYSNADIYTEITFDFTFTESDKHQIKILDSNDEVIYRGLSIATSQEPQEYLITKNAYYY